MHVGNQSPLETRTQPFFERRDLFGRTVARQHDLLVVLVQVVKGVEHFLLRARFVGDKLNIVYHQNVHVAVFVAKIGALAFGGANRRDKLVYEFFAGGV